MCFFAMHAMRPVAQMWAMFYVQCLFSSNINIWYSNIHFHYVDESFLNDEKKWFMYVHNVF